MSDVEAVRHFYRERVPAQFGEALANQRERAKRDADAARVLEEMEAVRTSIAVCVEVGGGQERFAYDVELGAVELVDAASHGPFLILEHGLADFAPLRQACGDSLLGFLGALAGLGDEMRLTTRRVRDLRALAGGLAFECRGPHGFRVIAHFGVERRVEVPRATIRIDSSTYARLRTGELDAQDAFLAGEIEVLGDEAAAIDLALTALAPD